MPRVREHWCLAQCYVLGNPFGIESASIQDLRHQTFLCMVMSVLREMMDCSDKPVIVKNLIHIVKFNHHEPSMDLQLEIGNLRARQYVIWVQGANTRCDLKNGECDVAWTLHVINMPKLYRYISSSSSPDSGIFATGSFCNGVDADGSWRVTRTKCLRVFASSTVSISFGEARFGAGFRHWSYCPTWKWSGYGNYKGSWRALAVQRSENPDRLSDVLWLDWESTRQSWSIA